MLVNRLQRNGQPICHFYCGLCVSGNARRLVFCVNKQTLWRRSTAHLPPHSSSASLGLNSEHWGERQERKTQCSAENIWGQTVQYNVQTPYTSSFIVPACVVSDFLAVWRLVEKSSSHIGLFILLLYTFHLILHDLNITPVTDVCFWGVGGWLWLELI